MTVIDRPRGQTRTRPRPRAKVVDLREAIEALKPGDVFSIDRPITVDEFCEYVSDECHAELVDGVIQILTPPNDAHEALFVWLITVLGIYIEVRGLGQLRGGRSTVQISRTSARQPDLLFFRKDRLDQMSATGLHGTPDLVIEIVDSARARREAVRKQSRYEEIGVAELLVVDLPRRELRHFVLEDGELRPVDVDPAGELVSRTVEVSGCGWSGCSRAPPSPAASRWCRTSWHRRQASLPGVVDNQPRA
jgi:Uma2 family endonuclease